MGGTGGDGGNGGSIHLEIAASVAGDVTLSAAGGAKGSGGMGGAGGNGGNGGKASISGEGDCGEGKAEGGDGGNGGDGRTGGSRGAAGDASATCDYYDLNAYPLVFGAAGNPGQSLPEQYNGADGEDGAGGSITVVLSAAVGGNMSADAGTGTVSVTLNTGAAVGGTISANEAAQSVLRFAMTVNSRADYKAAKAYMGDQANALSGSITIDGKVFTWTGFDELVQALVFAGVRSSAASDTGAPVYLSCSPRAVTAFHKNGGIELIASRTAERGAFRIGQVLGLTFVSQNSTGWTVRFDGGAVGIRFDVLEPGGGVAATCTG